MSTPTPGPNTLECGCHFRTGYMAMCPLHAQAPAMLEILKSLTRLRPSISYEQCLYEISKLDHQARALLADWHCLYLWSYLVWMYLIRYLAYRNAIWIESYRSPFFVVLFFYWLVLILGAGSALVLLWLGLVLLFVL